MDQGTAWVYFKINGISANAVKDAQGGEWSGRNASGFRFTYVKQGDEIKMKESWIFGDPAPALKLMIQNKMLSGDQLAGMLSQ